jgi:hypothetical protein
MIYLKKEQPKDFTTDPVVDVIKDKVLIDSKSKIWRGLKT